MNLTYPYIACTKSHVPFPLPKSYQMISPSLRHKYTFRMESIFSVRSCQHLSQPQAGGPPPFGCPRLLFQYICSYRPYWRPFLRPQPEDAPCLRDRYPLIMYNCFNGTTKSHFHYVYLVLRNEGKRGLYCTVFVQILTSLCIQNFAHKT